MSLRTDSVVDIRSLPRVAPGYAYVTGVEVHGQVGVLRLRYPRGREVLARFPPTDDGPDRGEGLDPVDPLSVIITNGPKLRCLAIARSTGGAYPVPISARSAWACVRRGVHTVLISESAGDDGDDAA